VPVPSVRAKDERAQRARSLDWSEPTSEGVRVSLEGTREASEGKKLARLEGPSEAANERAREKTREASEGLVRLEGVLASGPSPPATADGRARLVRAQPPAARRTSEHSERGRGLLLRNERGDS
jgi:hypothetical protein